MKNAIFLFLLFFCLQSFSALGQEQEPNNSAAFADTLILDQSKMGSLSDADEHDWFAFEVPTAGWLSFSVGKAGGALRLRLKDAQREGAPQFDFVYFGPADSLGNVRFPVLAGHFFVHLQQSGSDQFNYSLTATLAPPTWPGDPEPNRDTSEAIVVTLDQPFTGTIGYYAAGQGTDEHDWYRFELPEAGLLTVRVQKSGEEVRFYLRDGIDASNIANISIADADTLKFLIYYLQAGTYFIEVDRILSELADYQVILSLAPASWGDDPEPNDEYDRADTIALGEPVSGTIGYYRNEIGEDGYDWYFLPIDQSGLLMVIMEKAGEELRLNFRNAERSRLTNLDLGDAAKKDTLYVLVDSGGYYLEIDRILSEVADYQFVTDFLLPPTAVFSYTQTANSILFGNTSDGAEAYHWDFGDGQESEATAPLHVYAQPGVFQACLTAVNLAGEDRYCSFIEVQGLVSVYPNTVGNAGTATLTVYGGGLRTGSTISVLQNGNVLAQTEDTYLSQLDGLVSRFNFTGLATGLYDVSVTTPEGATYALPGSLTIEPATEPEPWVELSGRRRILFNTPSTYFLRFGNKGNVDARVVPIYLAISDLPDLEVELKGGELTAILEDGLGKRDSLVPPYLEVDSVLNEPFKARVYLLIIPTIPANSTQEFEVKIKTSATIKIKTWVNQAFIVGEQPLVKRDCDGCVDDHSEALVKRWNLIECLSGVFTLNFFKDSPFYDLRKEEIQCVLDEYQIRLAVLTGAYDKQYIKDNLLPGFDRPNSKQLLVSQTQTLTEIFNNCILIIPPSGFVRDAMSRIFSNMMVNTWLRSDQLESSIDKCYQSKCEGGNTPAIAESGEMKVEAAKEGKTGNTSATAEFGQCTFTGTFAPMNERSRTIRAVSSFDPNEKEGPTGFGVDNFTDAQTTVPYTIHFENVDSATAPAHVVRVTDQLDPAAFDLSSFEFGPVTIADTTLFPEKGQTTLLMDHYMPQLDVVARITAALDTLTGEVAWQIASLQPGKLEPVEDPDVGFLPPNQTKPEGQGSVSFTIDVAGIPMDGDQFINDALIYFDANAPIQTNLHRITFDLASPESAVQNLQQQIMDTLIEVSWGGADAGSGIRYYDVYVAEPDSAFQRWLFRTTAITDTFVGEVGKTYQFFSVAVDSVGNEEPFPETADASTTLVVGTQEATQVEVTVWPNPVEHTLWLRLPEGRNFTIRILDATGREVRRAHTQGRTVTGVSMASLPTGLYFYQLQTREGGIVGGGRLVKGEY
jgi:PKD repeat protein